MADAPRYVLERGERLSNSVLWQLQRQFYTTQGIEAWRQEIIPHYITSNAFIADQYARVVAAYLGGRAANLADPEQPIHIVEFGAGSGTFAALFLRRLIALTERVDGAPAWKYVMTDVADNNVAFWRAHPMLRAHVARGLLDFARFDAHQDRELVLLESGEKMDARTNGLVVLANYFFDGIATDVFTIQGGELLESTVSLSVHAPLDPKDPHLLEHIQMTFAQRPTEAAGYYEDPEFDRVLAGYQALGDTWVRLPIAGLRLCKLMREWSGDQLLVVSSDKGYIREEQLRGLPEPSMVLHGGGCFSLQVDYAAMGAYFRNAGGQVMHQRNRHEWLLTVAYVLGEHPDRHRATRDMFAATIEEFGPDEFFRLAWTPWSEQEPPTISQILALLHLGRHDPRLLARCMPALEPLVPTASRSEKEELLEAIEASWDLYFHLGNVYDLPFEVSRLLYAMGLYADALRYCERSLALYSECPHTRYNMSLCHYYMQQPAQALADADRTLALDPAHAGAKAMREELAP